ncbi:MAG: ATP-binding protein [Polaromonas sp.]|uniref:sensor histidine kinase n=1 Tax=Polaromonas sp. TaxID=1869339 RepID=UPI00248A3C3A|nr:ATP-binding protein [Polaromonas sp.]MDI1236853.1 ATP-binding protein [Polaromonas sp.]MDI1340423.1 ATP-binding protein [Polaromonas sp.]
MTQPPEPVAVSAVPAMAALLQKIRDGDDVAAAEQEILRITGLLEDELNQRSTQVVAANKELENFSYSVSHDLRAPLSTIDGFSRLLEGAVAKGNAERSTHYLQRIRLGVGNINELIAALLAVSRLLRAPLAPQAVDLGALAEAAFAALQEVDPERAASITVQPALIAQGDPALLKQLVDHLAGNAWKFSAKKERAAIAVGSQAGPGGETVYFFKDNGAGFDMAHAEKLFGIFQRMHVSSDFPGIGAGLSIVQRIVARHGGRVWAEAELERGATIYFTLPGA